jgi:hypothetical protein
LDGEGNFNRTRYVDNLNVFDAATIQRCIASFFKFINDSRVPFGSYNNYTGITDRDACIRIK